MADKLIVSGSAARINIYHNFPSAVTVSIQVCSVVGPQVLVAKLKTLKFETTQQKPLFAHLDEIFTGCSIDCTQFVCGIKMMRKVYLQVLATLSGEECE